MTASPFPTPNPAVEVTTARRAFNEPASLPVVETFHSLQGEGLHSGRSAFFVRLAGCDVGCSWCDTKHSWSEANHPRRRLVDLAAAGREAAAAGAGFVVITGGEPLQHPLEALCSELRAATRTVAAPNGLPLHLETSGVNPLSGRFDWITLSPKRHRPPGDALLAACDELKVVVQEPADIAFAEAMAARALALRQAGWAPTAGALGTAGEASAGPVLLLQPAWGELEGQRLAISHVQCHPTWRLSLQTHKVLRVR
jgi:organic radical activating enzyme